MSGSLKYLTATILVLNIFSSPTLAGTGPATLNCKSKSAKPAITLKGTVPGDDGTNLTLTQGIVLKNKLDSNDNVSSHVLEAFEQGVFTMVVDINKGEEELKLYALPKSVKVKKAPGSIHGKFDAVLALNSSNPKNRIEPTNMTCSFDYEP
jgi:hypothetical protein